MRLSGLFATLSMFATLAMATACGDDGGTDPDPSEVITTVTLELVPAGGGATVTASFDDPDGDGGAAPTIDPIALVAGTSYMMAVRFQNRLVEPPEEITDEIRAEAEEHQLFFTGTAVDGPASDHPGAPLTHTYADTDASGLPIGLASTIAATAGTGELTVTLRHLPPINGVPTKTADLAADVRAGGFAAIAGSTDAQVTFQVTVTPPGA